MRKLYKALFVCLIFTGLVFSPLSPALAAEVDFGIEDPGILPVSPLYFLKEWRRDLMRSVTKDDFSKLALELHIWNEKGAEFLKVEELKKGEMDALEESFENYLFGGEAFVGALEAYEGDTGSEEFGELEAEVKTHGDFILELLWKYGGKKSMGELFEDGVVQIYKALSFFESR